MKITEKYIGSLCEDSKDNIFCLAVKSNTTAQIE